MFGMIGQIRAQPGQRRQLMEILLAAVPGMDGCLAYIIAEDQADDDAFWITEAWQDEESHRAALASPGVRDAIARGRPLIADMAVSARTRPVGGIGL